MEFLRQQVAPVDDGVAGVSPAPVNPKLGQGEVEICSARYNGRFGLCIIIKFDAVAALSYDTSTLIYEVFIKLSCREVFAENACTAETCNRKGCDTTNVPHPNLTLL